MVHFAKQGDHDGFFEKKIKMGFALCLSEHGASFCQFQLGSHEILSGNSEWHNNNLLDVKVVDLQDHSVYKKRSKSAVRGARAPRNDRPQP
jgi:hypothetical protein